MNYFYVCDGSYLSRKSGGVAPKSGVGVVQFLEGSNIDPNNRVLSVFSEAVESMGGGKFHGPACAEGLAVAVALNHAAKNSDVMIYTDNVEVVRFMHGTKSALDGSEVAEILSKAIYEHNAVTACHISERNREDVPSYLFAIAHNAATAATGAKKKEHTGEYVGEYSYNSDLDAVITPYNHRSDVTGIEIIGGDVEEESHEFDPRYPKPKLP